MPTVDPFRKLNPLRRLALVLLTGALAGSAAALLNHAIFVASHSEQESPGVARQDLFARSGFAVGMSLGAMTLTAPDGRLESLVSIASEHEETVLHFVDRLCPPCIRDLYGWGVAAETVRVPTLFVACNESHALQQLEGLGERPRNLYTLVGTSQKSGAPQTVPLTIVVDRQATIIGCVPGVREFVRRWHG